MGLDKLLRGDARLQASQDVDAERVLLWQSLDQRRKQELPLEERDGVRQ